MLTGQDTAAFEQNLLLHMPSWMAYDMRLMSERFGGVLILNRQGRKREQVGSDVAAGLADMESLGVMALANPDLVSHLKTGMPLTRLARTCFMPAAVRRATSTTLPLNPLDYTP